jgi:hypothetical protein
VITQQLTHWLTGGAAWWIIAAALRALPEPLPMGSRFYLWLYRFAGIIGANFDKISPPFDKISSPKEKVS